MKKRIEITPQNQSNIRKSVFLYFFFVGLCFSSWACRIPEIKGALGLDDAQWGAMLFMIPIGQLIGMTFSGRLISKVGSNRVIRVASIGYSLSLLMIGVSAVEGATQLFIAALMGFGFFGNFCNIAMNTQGVIVENFYNRPIMASFHAGWSLAGLLGGAVGLAMTTLGVSTPVHFGVITAFVVVGSMMQYSNLQYDATCKVKDDSEAKESATKGAEFEMFLILLGVVGFFGWVSEGTMADWSGLYMQSIVGVDERFTPIALTLYMVAMTVGRFMLDRTIARWGRRIVLMLCCGAIFVGMAISVLLPYAVTSLAGFMVVGLGTCGVIPILYSVAGEKTKMHTGRALTIVSTISFAGFLIGPPIIGFISEATSLRYSFALIGVLGLVALFMSARIKILRS